MRCIRVPTTQVDKRMSGASRHTRRRGKRSEILRPRHGGQAEEACYKMRPFAPFDEAGARNGPIL